jgi:hypothetical protein
MQSLAARIAANGGGALVVDYGYRQQSCGDSLQALRNHQRHDPLADPGTADITAHVDFASLAASASAAGAAVYGPLDQGPFLISLGLAARADNSVCFTFAPRTALLATVWAVGKLFPRSDRSPAIVPVSPRHLSHLLARKSGLTLGRTHRVSRAFYISQALEITAG